MYKASLTSLYLQVLLKGNIGSNLHVCTQLYTLLRTSIGLVLRNLKLLTPPSAQIFLKTYMHVISVSMAKIAPFFL